MEACHRRILRLCHAPTGQVPWRKSTQIDAQEVLDHAANGKRHAGDHNAQHEHFQKAMLEIQVLGNGNVKVEALPADKVVSLMRKYGKIR